MPKYPIGKRVIEYIKWKIKMTTWESVKLKIRYRLSAVKHIALKCSRGNHQPIFGAGSAWNLVTGKVTTWSDEGWSCFYCGKKLRDNWQ